MRKWARALQIIILAASLSGCKAAPRVSTPVPGNSTLASPIGNAQAEGPSAASLPLGPGGGGVFEVFAFSPDYVFVGTDLGGIFRSGDHGQSWQTANRGLLDYVINDIAVDPANPAVLYAATPGGVYKSTNSGDSWTLLKNGFPPKESDRYSAEIGTVAVDPLQHQILYAGVGNIRAEQLARGNGDIYRSTDEGASWTRFNIGDPAAASYKIVVDPLRDGNVYAATSHGFFTSPDRGQTWTQIDNMQSRGLVAGINQKRSTVVLYRTAWTSGIYKSVDSGTTWQKVSNFRCPHNCEFYRIALDPSDPAAAKVFVGDYGDWNEDQGVFETSDGGSSWKQINTILEGGWAGSEKVTRVRALGLNSYQPSELYYGHSMGLYRTQDQAQWHQVYTTGMATSGGESVPWPGEWRGRGSIDNTQANTRPIFHPKNYAEYYLGFSDLYIWGTANNGNTWVNLQIPGDNDVRALAADPRDTDFRTWFAGTAAQECCSGALYKTVDGGRNWRRASGLPDDRILDIAIPGADADLVYAATQNNGLYLSTDGGVSFASQNGVGGSMLPDGSIYRIALDPRHAETLYAAVTGHRGGIFESLDGGRTWLKTGDATNCYAVAVSPSDPQELFAGCGLQLYASKDGGAHWRTLFDAATRTNGGYIRDITLHPVDANIACLVIKDDPYHDQASGGGLHCTIDGGATWKETAAPLGLLFRGTAVAFHPLANPATGDHDLFYMTGGNGAYRIPFKLLVKMIQEQPPE